MPPPLLRVRTLAAAARRPPLPFGIGRIDAALDGAFACARASRSGN